MMTNIINNIKALMNVSQTSEVSQSNKTNEQSMKCNYANDYYGDQLCR